MSRENVEEQLQALAREYNIFFRDPKSTTEWPSRYNELFGNVHKLGQADIRSYEDTVISESWARPWRSSMSIRARRLAKVSGRLAETAANEATWRSHLEPEVFARFNTEVQCGNCRRRLWRAEVEVNITSTAEDYSLQSLYERQARRKACDCDDALLTEQRTSEGLTDLFWHVEEEVVENSEPELASMLPIRHEQPDKIFGLLATAAFKRLAPRATSSNVRVSPFSASQSDSVLYPFLVLEAKSQRSRDDLRNIRTQTAFPIRTLLRLQAELFAANGRANSVPSLPLVWFLANKGPTWFVSAAYTEVTGEENYICLHLWTGNVSQDDKALQLLLIIDHIVDWARDAYRPSILTELKHLTQANTLSVFEEERNSLAEHVLQWQQHPGSSTIASLNRAPLHHIDRAMSFKALDSPFATAIRSAKAVTYRVLGLRITEEGFPGILEIMDKNRKLSASVLRVLESDVWIIRRGFLNQLEMQWTGNMRAEDPEPSHGSINQDADYLVRLSFCAYLSDNFDQVREVCFIAVARELYRPMVAHLGQKLGRHMKSDYGFRPREENLTKFCQQMRHERQHLLTSLQRPTWISASKKTAFDHDHYLQHTDDLEYGVIRLKSSNDLHEIAVKASVLWQKFCQTLNEDQTAGLAKRSKRFLPYGSNPRPSRRIDSTSQASMVKDEHVPTPSIYAENTSPHFNMLKSSIIQSETSEDVPMTATRPSCWSSREGGFIYHEPFVLVRLLLGTVEPEMPGAPPSRNIMTVLFSLQDFDICDKRSITRLYAERIPAVLRRGHIYGSAVRYSHKDSVQPESDLSNDLKLEFSDSGEQSGFTVNGERGQFSNGENDVTIMNSWLEYLKLASEMSSSWYDQDVETRRQTLVEEWAAAKDAQAKGGSVSEHHEATPAPLRRKRKIIDEEDE